MLTRNLSVLAQSYVDAKKELDRYVREWDLNQFGAGVLWGMAVERTQTSAATFRDSLHCVLEEHRKDRQGRAEAVREEK